MCILRSIFLLPYSRTFAITNTNIYSSFEYILTSIAYDVKFDIYIKSSISFQVVMKSAILQGLLCILIGSFTASIAKAQLTTSRYNYVIDENLNVTNSYESTLFSKRNILKSINYLNVYATGNAQPRKLKNQTNPVNLSLPSGNSSPPHFTKNKKVVKNTLTLQNVPLYQSKLVGNESNLRNKTVNTVLTMRPKVKYKPHISKPITTGANKSSSSALKKSNNLELIKVNSEGSITAQLPTINTKPLNSRINISKLKNSYKTQSMNKQSIDTLNPEIITYAPDISITNTRPVTSFPSSQNMLLQIRPQIDTYSPEYSINGISSESEGFSGDAIDSNQSNNPLSIPSSQVIIQSLSNNNMGIKDSLQNDCPSFLLHNNVFGPQRQGCSDLNIVINSHLNQNVITEAVPEIVANQVQADESAVDAPTQLASPAADAQPAPVAAPATALETAPSQSTNSGNPSGGLPQLPSLPELSLPDVKGLFDLLGALWRIVSPILGFFTNPYLYLVPAGVSFALGFIKIIGAFKVFIVVPALLLFGYINRDKPPEVAYYKHVHKPIHHNDGWFWNHNTKTWNNVADYKHIQHVFPATEKVR